MSAPSLRALPRQDDEFEEADRFADFPHPREMLDLIGHAEEERLLLEAYRSGRMHHAWIFGGPEGIGKATLAYRLARFLLAHPDPRSGLVERATSLDVEPSSRAARLVASQAHPDLAVLRRNWNHERKTLSTEIRVPDVRKIRELFGSTASAGGWRIVILDAAEDLNANSANALLKMMEEPPPRSILLIIAHAPGRVLPTIRSRCRMLPLRTLSSGQVRQIVSGLSGDEHDEVSLSAAAEHAEGSVRRAFRLLDGGMLSFRSRLESLFSALPVLRDQDALAIAEEAAKRDGLAFDHFVEATEHFLSAAVAARSSEPPSRLIGLAEAYAAFAIRRREAETYNLDRRPVVLHTLSDLAEAVRESRT